MTVTITVTMTMMMTMTVTDVLYMCSILQNEHTDTGTKFVQELKLFITET